MNWLTLTSTAREQEASMTTAAPAHQEGGREGRWNAACGRVARWGEESEVLKGGGEGQTDVGWRERGVEERVGEVVGVQGSARQPARQPHRAHSPAGSVAERGTNAACASISQSSCARHPPLPRIPPPCFARPPTCGPLVGEHPLEADRPVNQGPNEQQRPGLRGDPA
jgi:hypothetical protein